MPYVLHNDAGKILALYDKKEDINARWLDDNAPDVINFKQSLINSNQAVQELAASDMELIRVLEDIVDLLIKKQVFVFTELPDSAQAKLSKRRKVRGDMLSLTSLINNEEGIF